MGQYTGLWALAEKIYNTVIPASDEKPYEVAYSESEPASDWIATTFNDQSWKRGGAPFTDDNSSAKTLWKSKTCGRAGNLHWTRQRSIIFFKDQP